MSMSKRCVSFLLAALFVLTVMCVGIVPGTTVKTEAAGKWNGYNYGGGTLYGSQTILEAYGIKYDVYMKWLDDHDKDSANPNYYLGTPYVSYDHRNPRGDCGGAYGAYDVPGVAGLNCTGFVWHVLYKAAVHSGASRAQINRLGVMGGVLSSWYANGVYRIWFNSLDEAYRSGVMEKGDVMWIYGSSDNHNAIFYGNNPHHWIYWDSAGERNRMCEVHSIGSCLGVWVCKVTQPKKIELQMDTASGGSGTKFSTKYMIFDSKAKAQACIDNPNNNSVWDKRVGSIILDSKGHGVFRQGDSPQIKDLWEDDTPLTRHSYFSTPARKVDASKTYYAVQWRRQDGISEDKAIHEFKDSGKRTDAGYRIFKTYAPIKVGTPTVKQINTVYNGVSLKWSAVKNAYKYRVYRKNSSGAWVRIAQTASTSYLDKKVKRGSTYTYTVRCIDKYGNLISEYNKSGWKQKFQYLDTPKVTAAKSTGEGVKLTWNAVKNTIDNKATLYRVYRKNTKGKWVRVKQTTATTFTDNTVSRGKKYAYTVRCIDSAGRFVSNYNSTGWSHTYKGVSTPTITYASSEADGVRLTWNAVDADARYRVYGKNASGKWIKLAETASTEYVDQNVTAGSSYTYTVRCVNSKGTFTSDYNKTGWKAIYYGTAIPEITEIRSASDGEHITWNAVEGVAKYRIYTQDAAGKWTKLTETAGTTYVDSSVSLGKAKTYTVRCVNSSGKFASDYYKTGWSHTFSLDTPQLTAAEQTEDGVWITWNAVDGASQYRVYVQTENGWQAFANVAGTEALYTDVTPGSYTFTVRCVGLNDKFVSDFDHTGTTVVIEAPAE